jgi:UDP-N-acetylmuramate--alanine ligase
MDEFARSFHGADHVYLLDIYAASEKPIEGVTSEVLAERMRGFGHRSVEFVGSLENAAKAVAANAKEGDAVLTLGAGNVWQAGDKLLQNLREAS